MQLFSASDETEYVAFKLNLIVFFFLISEPFHLTNLLSVLVRMFMKNILFAQ